MDYRNSPTKNVKLNLTIIGKNRYRHISSEFKRTAILSICILIVCHVHCSSTKHTDDPQQKWENRRKLRSRPFRDRARPCIGMRGQRRYGCINWLHNKHCFHMIIKKVCLNHPVFNMLIIVYEFIGDPLPKVTWWQSGSLFDSSDEVTRTGVILNRMVYKGLQREDLGKTFTCQAANTNLTIPVSAEVKIIINCK